MAHLANATDKARERLEKAMQSLPKAEYQEEGGSLVKRVTQVQIMSAVQVLGENQEAISNFLLHLDDRITEQNGYRGLIEETQQTINTVQKRVEEICSERELTCPNTPKISELTTLLNGHLSQEEKEELIEKATTEEREKLIKQGQDEAERRFKRITVTIGTMVGLIGITITIAAFIINHFL